MMHKQNYEAIAEVIAGDMAIRHDDPVGRNAVRCVALSLSDVFMRDNKLFDRNKFLRACGLKQADAPMSITDEDPAPVKSAGGAHTFPMKTHRHMPVD